ncbi:Fic family protein [soil metagenome]
MRLPQAPPSYLDLLDEMGPRHSVDLMIRRDTGPLDRRGRYLHWDEMRNRTPPDGLDHREWWMATKYARTAIARPLPLRATSGEVFTFSNVDPVHEAVHAIDQKAGGHILSSDRLPAERTRYLVSSLTEEAITSSQLEGATTTRKDAKRLLAPGRQPRDKSELMIVNNYRAMTRAKELMGRELTPRDVLDLHRIVTEGTLDDEDDAGRLQRPEDERIGVFSEADGTQVHVPPRAEELPDRLEDLCRFAAGATGVGFLHPVVRAILLHFALAYDHPFSDGNGRTARALFYWSLLRDGYWLAEYASISSILKQAPAKYGRSFLYTESDAHDVTYFVLYQLDVLQRSIDDLSAYSARRAEELQSIEAIVRGRDVLNHRQRDLVSQSLSDAAVQFTIAEHQGLHGVTYQTARTDLLGLTDLGLFEKRKDDRKFVFVAHHDLEARLRALGSGTT